MLGTEVADDERASVTTAFVSDDLLKLFWKKFLAPMDLDAPIGELSDTWLGVENMVFGQSPDTILQAISYKQTAIDLTKKALALLTDPSAEKPDIEYSPLKFSNDPLQINLMARNKFIQNVENQLLFMKLIAAQATMTPADALALQNANSAK